MAKDMQNVLKIDEKEASALKTLIKDGASGLSKRPKMMKKSFSDTETTF